MKRSRWELRVTLLVAGMIGLCIGLIAWRSSQPVRPTDEPPAPGSQGDRSPSAARQPPPAVPPDHITFPRTSIYALEFVPNKPHLVVAGASPSSAFRDQPTVQLWDLDANKEVATLQREGEVGRYTIAANSPDGKRLAAAGLLVVGGKSLGNVCVWNLETRVPAWSAQFGPAVTCVAWSPDGLRLAVGDGTGVVTVRDGETGTVRDTWKPAPEATAAIEALAWSRDSQLLAASTVASAHVWDVATRKELAATRAPKNHFSALAFGPDSGTLLVAGRWTAKDVWVWDYTADRETRQLAKHAAIVAGFAVRGSTLITTSFEVADGGFAISVRAWHTATGQHLWTVSSLTATPTANPRQCAVSPDGKRVAVAVMEHTDAGAKWRVELHTVPVGK